MTGSNRRPSACKADALPAELILHADISILFLMVTRTGFEPVYACVKGMCVKPLHQRAFLNKRLIYFNTSFSLCQQLFYFILKQLLNHSIKTLFICQHLFETFFDTFQRLYIITSISSICQTLFLFFQKSFSVSQNDLLILPPLSKYVKYIFQKKYKTA